MKELYIVSLCYNGILGGVIYLTEGCAVYRTGKLTIPEKYRNLKMPYSEITDIQTGSLLLLPTVSISLNDFETYKFVVFARKKFIERLSELVKNAQQK